ncbi:MAG: hypothetical protein J6P28_02150 [Treponema sp.]|nr:hypothetical protein [Treponema sp.]
MGIWDALCAAGSKVNKYLEKQDQETKMWIGRLQGKSVQELKRIAQTGSPVSKKLAACQILKQNGYGN